MAVMPLRRCYSTECRVYRDDPRTVTLTWYWVDEGAPVLPFPTVFTSNQWDEDCDNPNGLGEVPGADIVWRDGTAPFPVGGGPPCGTADNFINGLSVPPVPPVNLNVYGGVSCCPLPPSPFIHYACVNLPGGAWDTYTLSASGADLLSQFGQMNGHFPQSYVGACVWDFTLIELLGHPLPGLHTYKWQFVVRPGNVKVGLQEIGGTFHSLYTSAGPWDGMSVIHCPLDPAQVGIGYPTDTWIRPGSSAQTGPVCFTTGAPVFRDYNLVTPAYSAGRKRFIPAGTYLVGAAPRCSWVGTVPLRQVRYQANLFAGQVDANLFLRGDLSLRLNLTLRYPTDNDVAAQFLSDPGWDEETTIALVRTTSDASRVQWPLAVQVVWPGSP